MISVLNVDIDNETREVTLNLSGSVYHIMLSDYKALSIDAGDTVEQDVFDSIVYYDQKLLCVKQAFKLMSYADYSSGRLSLKLKRNFDKRVVQETIAILAEHEYLRDADLCADYARNNYEIKKHGPIRIKQDLYNLGFPSDVISQTVAEYESMDHSENLREILETKFASRDPQNAQKAFAALYRLGYPYDDIREAVENYFESEL